MFVLLVILLQSYVAAFFKDAGMKNTQKQVVVVEPPFYFELSRTVTTFFVTFTYYPNINMTKIDP
jgi:hypothetical protein